MTVYADTSFFVSLYVEDRHSVVAERMMESHPRIWLTPLHYAEWAHAIAQQVFRHIMTTAEAERILRDFATDRTNRLWEEVAHPDHAFEVCADLARRHGPRLGVRTLDSLHVAIALELKADHFWTFDDRQAELAKAVGLKRSGPK